MKQAERITLHLIFSFLNERLDIEIMETDTTNDLKETLHKRIGYPVKILSIDSKVDKDLPDHFPIWACNDFKNDQVKVDRKILLLVKNDEKIVRKSYYYYTKSG